MFLSQLCLILYGVVHLDFIYCSWWRIGKSYTFINYATIHVVLKTLCIFFLCVVSNKKFVNSYLAFRNMICCGGKCYNFFLPFSNIFMHTAM